eukprot:TRINITY_DN545_c0_g1_i13.p1 TRINITY_DN545_c0_g1~~TRINITY_DN545_c0_g1_i13.p1  ORF type:complete len:552 (-),score=231.26 TRINITY_DN545_c0_g1_i13:128-1783(-)
MLELYRKQIWTDAKSVNAIASGCLSKSSKMVVAACKFMLSLELDKEDLEENESDQEDKKVELRRQLGSKLPKKKKDELRKILKLLERKQKRKFRKTFQKSFLPIDQIYDPQGFTEKLFAKLTKGKGKKKELKGEVAALALDLVAKMIGRHKLIIPEFFTYTNHLVKAKNKNIASILASIAEACHENLQHDDVKDVAGTVIDNMVSEHCQPEFITMGLNVIREIALRMPQVLTEDQLAYLVQFKDYKNRYVAAAAKSVVNAYRDINPTMLPKKLRGMNKTAEEGVTDAQGKAAGLEPFLKQEGRERLFNDILSNTDLKKIRLMQLQETAEAMGNMKEVKDVSDLVKERIKNLRKEYMEENEELKLGGKRKAAEEYYVPEHSDEEADDNDSDDQNNEESEEFEDFEGSEISGELEEIGDEELNEDPEMAPPDDEPGDSELGSSDSEDVYANQGFVSLDNIDTFKKPKRERIRQELASKIRDPHKKRIKQKTGSTSNEEKARHKPYMMVLPKKKTEILRAKYKSIKERIKELKKKSTKVRQGKIKVSRKIYVKS